MALLLVPFASAMSTITLSASECHGGELVTVAADVADGVVVHWSDDAGGEFGDDEAAFTHWRCPSVDEPTVANLWVTSHDESSQDYGFAQLTLLPTEDVGCATGGSGGPGRQAATLMALAALARRRAILR